MILVLEDTGHWQPVPRDHGQCSKNPNMLGWSEEMGNAVARVWFFRSKKGWTYITLMVRRTVMMMMMMIMMMVMMMMMMIMMMMIMMMMMVMIMMMMVMIMIMIIVRVISVVVMLLSKIII